MRCTQWNSLRVVRNPAGEKPHQQMELLRLCQPCSLPGNRTEAPGQCKHCFEHDPMVRWKASGNFHFRCFWDGLCTIRSLTIGQALTASCSHQKTKYTQLSPLFEHEIWYQITSPLTEPCMHCACVFGSGNDTLQFSYAFFLFSALIPTEQSVCYFATCGF